MRKVVSINRGIGDSVGEAFLEDAHGQRTYLWKEGKKLETIVGPQAAQVRVIHPPLGH